MGEEEGQLESAVSPFWSRIQTREREIIGLHSTWWVDQCRVGVIALAILQISPLQRDVEVTPQMELIQTTHYDPREHFLGSPHFVVSQGRQYAVPQQLNRDMSVLAGFRIRDGGRMKTVTARGVSLLLKKVHVCSQPRPCVDTLGLVIAPAARATQLSFACSSPGSPPHHFPFPSTPTTARTNSRSIGNLARFAPDSFHHQSQWVAARGETPYVLPP
ncbi:hypothetical protein HYQ44_013372 [Verticillium longisporum]|nr:hypothetical protein HYQ44_013372 [Verticillium longisporum]